MDLAYDQIAADALPKDNEQSSSENKATEQQASLNEDLQEAYRAISTSAWGSKLGGFFGTVVKQVMETSVDLGVSHLPNPYFLCRANRSTEKHHRNLLPWASMPPEEQVTSVPR
jgi:hypothetical protein